MFAAALIFLLLNRLADGLDGAVARQTAPSALGAYIDIVSDFLLWALLPDPIALNWSILLHFWWAGLGMFWLLRGLERSPLAALFGAVGFAFSGFLATHSLYLGMLHAAAWLPWLLGGVVRRWHGLAGIQVHIALWERNRQSILG